MEDRINAFFNGFAKAYDMFGSGDIDNKKHIKIESGFEKMLVKPCCRLLKMQMQNAN